MGYHPVVDHTDGQAVQDLSCFAFERDPLFWKIEIEFARG
jgi:hypothetical protein